MEIGDFGAQALDLAVQCLALYPPALRRPSRTGRFTQRPLLQRTAQQGQQTLDGVGPVLFLAAERLRLDYYHALFRDAPVAQILQRSLALFGQRGAANIESQVNCAGHLVHILAARTLGADHGELDFALVDKNGVLYMKHRQR